MTDEQIRQTLVVLRSELDQAEDCLRVGNRAGVAANMIALSQHADELRSDLDATRGRTYPLRTLP